MYNSKNEFIQQAAPFAKDLLAFAQDADKRGHITDVSIVVSGSASKDLKPENGEITQMTSGRGVYVSVTLYAGQKTISFTQNGMNKKALKKAIEDNAVLLPHLPENKFKGLLDPALIAKDQSQDDLGLYEENVPSNADLADYVLGLEETILSHNDIINTRGVQTSHSKIHTYKISTNGLERLSARSICSASGSAIAQDKKDGHMATYGDGAGGVSFSELPKYDELGSDIAKIASKQLNMITPETGNIPIILSAEAAETFINTVMSAIDAGSVYANDTFLKDKLGQQVINKSITLIDDPSIKGSLLSQNTDSAGMKSAPITFIENGILKTFNRSVIEARQIGMDPIGRENGPTNIILAPGDKTPEELMADIKTGIYVTNFAGGTANINDGNHSREALGYMMKDGKVTDQAVGGFVVSGNLKDMFMDVAIANDVPKLPDPRREMGVPTMRFDGLTIAGA